LIKIEFLKNIIPPYLIKANISDVSRTIAEISSALDGKITFEDVQLILKDYVFKSDM